MAGRIKHIDDLEELPEADRLEGFAHPRETLELIGHKKQFNQIIEAWQSERMHHAWLLSGVQGIGKATFAYQLARIILSHNINNNVKPSADIPGNDSSISRQIMALSHPGLLLIRRAWGRKEGKFASVIKVEDIRKLRNFIGMTAEEGTWRVVIVDRADEMNSNAANALLKSLEEPPANCVFFLITNTIGQMPVTIRSRCRKIDFDPLKPGELRNAVQNAFHAVERESLDKDKLDTLAGIANGSVRQILELSEGKGLSIYETIIKIMKKLPRLDYGDVSEFAETLSTPSALPDFEIFNTLFSDILHRMIRIGSGNGDAPEAEIRLAMKFVNEVSLAQWAELWETIAKQKREVLGLNLDRKNFLIEVFHQVEQTARKSAS